MNGILSSVFFSLNLNAWKMFFEIKKGIAAGWSEKEVKQAISK